MVDCFCGVGMMIQRVFGMVVLLWIRTDVEALVVNSSKDLGLNVEDMVNTIQQGRVYQHLNFLTESEVVYLLHEMEENEQCFQPSGLSELSKKQQTFNIQKDRSTCPVPWWNTQQQIITMEDDTHPTNPTLFNIQQKLQSLRTLLSDNLQRPTMMDTTLQHECYYSTSPAGSSLKIHMDERHEEMKGSRGWLLPSRRSISWLVYLSDPEWALSKNGGALRTYPPTKLNSNKSPIGNHDGNLQIGYLTPTKSSSTPVYLDCWFPLPNESTSTVEPHSILYIVDENTGDLNYITRPWVQEEQSHFRSLADFFKYHQTGPSTKSLFFVNQNISKAFQLLEDREAWDQGKFGTGKTIEDITPSRASLVMFDSVSLPHEVLKVTSGTRNALAGWFHEPTQPFPENIYNNPEL